jgi:hypothetical protein
MPISLFVPPLSRSSDSALFGSHKDTKMSLLPDGHSIHFALVQT